MNFRYSLIVMDGCSGCGLSVQSLGKALAVEGLISILTQLLLFRRLSRTLGLYSGFAYTNAFHILIAASLPLIRVVILIFEGSDAGQDEERRRSVVTWIAVIGWLAMTTVSSLAHSFSMIIINAAAPTKDALGAVKWVGFERLV